MTGSGIYGCWAASGTSVSVEAHQALPTGLALNDLEAHIPVSVLERRVTNLGLNKRATRAGNRILVRNASVRGRALADIEQVTARAPAAAGTGGADSGFCKGDGQDHRRFAVGYDRRRLPGLILLIGTKTADQARGTPRLIAGPGVIAVPCDAWDDSWRSPRESVIELPWPAVEWASLAA